MGESQINSTKQDASNMTNFVTSHNFKIDCEAINSANADITLKEHLNRFWEMEALDIESNSVHKAFKNEILTESIVLHLYLLNLITNQYRTILCYQSIAYIHLKINYTETQI